MQLGRRKFIHKGLALAALCTVRARAAPTARVGIIGGGFGGASLARYLRRHDSSLSITLIERDTSFVTCPFSNGVLGGLYGISHITFGYERLKEVGIEVIRGEATHLDPVKKSVVVAGKSLAFDFLVVAPGIDFDWGSIEGYSAKVASSMPHAWLAGAQTALLRQKLEHRPDGGLFIIAIPPMPYRCPPGPYERASLVAYYFKQHKPKSKILLLDSSDAFIKQDLFMEAWQRFYPSMIEWVPGSKSGKVVRVEPSAGKIFTAFDEYRAAVANIIPAQHAGRIALEAGLDAGTGYCAVDPQTFESHHHPDVFVIGDASIAGEMPKSGFAANNQAKACGRAILASIAGQSFAPAKLLNICYSMAKPDYAFSIVDGFEVRNNTIQLSFADQRTTPLGADANEHRLEADSARSWFANITTDMFG